MSNYDFFRKRVGVEEGDITLGAKSRVEVNKIKQNRKMDTSPNLKKVTIDDSDILYDCIISHDDKYWEKRFLFRPDVALPVGSYIHNDEGKYGKHIYLALERTTDDIYPQLFGVKCNTYYEIVTGTRIIETGVDDFGMPIFEEEDETLKIRCHATTQAYSALSNSPVPLPSGAMNIYIPYDKAYADLIQLNDKYVNNNAEYKVTEVVREHAIEEDNEGYLIIYLQRKVEKHE